MTMIQACNMLKGVLFLMSVCFPLVASQVFPVEYTFPTLTSVNGSSATGNCANVSSSTLGTQTCADPTSSVLFDDPRGMPILTGLDGDMWASQLLTIQTTALSTDITVDFVHTPDFNRVERVEVVIFNCPQLGIGVQTIQAFENNNALLQTANIDVTSCTSLVRVCLSTATTIPILILRFTLSPGSDWVHLAEVTFFGNGITCPPDIVITEPTTAPVPTEPSSAVETGGGATDSNEGTSTTSSELIPDMTTSQIDPPPSSNSAVTAAVVIVVIAILIIAAIIIIVVVIFCVRKRKEEYGLKTNGMGTLDRKMGDLELAAGGDAVYEDIDNQKTAVAIKGKQPSKTNKNGLTSSQKLGGGGGGGGGLGGGMYEELDAEPKPPRRSVYEPVNNYEKKPTKSPGGGGGEPNIYNRLREDEGAAAEEPDPSAYSQLERSGTHCKPLARGSGSVSTSQAASNPIYSNPDEEPEFQQSRTRRQTSPPAVYSVPDMGAKRNRNDAPVKPPRLSERRKKPAAPTAEYAVVDKKPSPAIPSKSPALLDQLKAEEQKESGGDDLYTEPTLPSESKLATLTKSPISQGSLSNNPMYASADDTLQGETDIYATPGPAAIPEPNPTGNIYEQIYNAPSLSLASFTKEPSPEISDDSEDPLCPYSSIYTVPELPANNDKLLEVTKENIKVIKTLGSGNFGEVVLATTVGLSCRDLKIGDSTDTDVNLQVAVKMLKEDADMTAKNLFQKEYLFMARLDHPNVVCLLGVCKAATAPFIMMEYMVNGDLNQFLQRYASVTDSDSPSETEISTKTLTRFCTQIASALEYLTGKDFVHRDIATRNCLVGENFHVKLADFGMSRTLYDSQYYVIKGHAILPVRWMATECFYGKFSAKSDVWAFGVTMWEIFELAKDEPYHGIGDRDLVQDAVKGPDRTLLSRPAACPEDVYQIMLSCWAHEKKDRATFEELFKKLSSL